MGQRFQRMVRIGLAGLLLLVLAVLALRPLPAVEPAGRKLTRDGMPPNTAGRRLALVVGNAHYKYGPLDNPAHDAEDMSKLLREIGFAVTSLTDVGLVQMRQGFDAFARDLRSNDEVIVYYSGHGVQYDGHNFLVPVDAAIARTDDLEQMTLSLDAVIEATSARKPAALVIVLDACRDRSTLHGNLRGLAEQRAAPHMLLAFATSPGTTASDGWGRNGLYTKHLLKHLGQPGATVEEVFKRVRLGVMEESEEQQVPMESSLLVRNLVLVPSAPVSAVAQSEAWMAGASESQLRV
ncbi:MAG: caspase domain-containing protein, partial [Sphingomonadaceae bacterium]